MTAQHQTKCRLCSPNSARVDTHKAVLIEDRPYSLQGAKENSHLGNLRTSRETTHYYIASSTVTWDSVHKGALSRGEGSVWVILHRVRSRFNTHPFPRWIYNSAEDACPAQRIAHDTRQRSLFYCKPESWGEFGKGTKPHRGVGASGDAQGGTYEDTGKEPHVHSWVFSAAGQPVRGQWGFSSKPWSCLLTCLNTSSRL